MNRRTLIIGICALSLGLASNGDADGNPEIAVVVRRSNGVGAMNRAQIAAIFKAKSTQFPGGHRADPVNLASESPVRQQFDLAVLGMRPDEVERYWVDSKIRSGVGSPRRLSGPDAVIRFVGGDDSGIGYVATADVTDAVRVVARIRGGEVVSP